MHGCGPLSINEISNGSEEGDDAHQSRGDEI